MPEMNQEMKEHLNDPKKRIRLAVKIKKEQGKLEELKEEYRERFGRLHSEIIDDRCTYGFLALLWCCLMWAIYQG